MFFTSPYDGLKQQSILEEPESEGDQYKVEDVLQLMMEFKVFDDALLTQQSSVTSTSIELKYENYYDREDILNLLSFTAAPIEEEEPIE